MFKLQISFNIFHLMSYDTTFHFPLCLNNSTKPATPNKISTWKLDSLLFSSLQRLLTPFLLFKLLLRIRVIFHFHLLQYYRNNRVRYHMYIDINWLMTKFFMWKSSCNDMVGSLWARCQTCQQRSFELF